MNLPKIFGKYGFHLLILLFFLTRLTNLHSLPIFNDEAIYIDWANKIRMGYVPIFYSLYDGKPPLHFLLISLFLFIIKNPLLAGRLVSVVAGLFTLIGIKKISEIILKNKWVYLPSILYIFSPLFLFYDRQALQEPILTALFSWFLYFLLVYMKSFKLRNAVFLSVLFSLMFMVKVSSLVFIFPLSILYILSFFRYRERINDLILALLFFIIIFCIIQIPMISQERFTLLFSRNDRYAYSFGDLNFGILELLISNFIKSAKFIIWDFNILIPVLFLSLFTKKYFISKNMLILLLLLLPIPLVIILSKNASERYLEPFLTPLIFFAAIGFIRLYEKIGKVIFILIFIPIMICIYQIFAIDGYLLFVNRYVKDLGLNSYIGGFTSGYGVRDALDFLKNESEKYDLMYVGVRVDAGNPESAVMAYFLGGENAKVKPMYFDSSYQKLPLTSDFVGYRFPFYFISRDDNLAGMNEYLIEVKRFYKPDNKSFVGVYKFIGYENY